MAARMTAYSNRPDQTANTSDGSRTITIHDVPTGEGNPPSGEGDAENGGGVLRLRGGGNTRRVVWSEETIDNEGMGKKKSKICCIYHKPKAFDESSDESSSASSSASDSDSHSDSESFSELSELSSSSHASNVSGVNASKSLREKKEGKKKRGDDHECKEGHKHIYKDRRRRQKKSRGSSTMTETISRSDSVEESSSRPTPNAYERGVA